MQFLASRTSILQRIADGDKNAVEECVDAYGNLIWRTVKKNVESAEEAEDFVLKIFNDLWKFADLFDPNKHAEDYFVFLIICRRLSNTRRILLIALQNKNNF